MRHLTAVDVRALLPMPAAIEAARSTALSVARGGVQTAERVWHRPDGMPGAIGVMPAHLPAEGPHPAIFTTKVVGVFPGATPSVAGIIVVLDATSGAPLATVDAAAVTAVRTAAASALSVEVLADPGAATLALIGAGVQARAHLEAVRAVRDIREVRVWNRTAARAEALARDAAALSGITRATAHDSPGRAADGAHIICVCTDSPTPVLEAADVAPGTHVTAIGAYRHDTRELAGDLMAAAAHIVVDDRDAAMEEAGDVLMALAEGAIDADAVTADLAELIGGTRTITRRPDQITIYKSVGTSAMDAVAVRHLLAAAAAADDTRTVTTARSGGGAMSGPG